MAVAYSFTVEIDGDEVVNASGDMNEVARFKCQECDATNAEETLLEGPLYECGSCSAKFVPENAGGGAKNQCPQCSKMAARLADGPVRPDCSEGEVDEITLYECCGEDFDPENDQDEMVSHIRESHLEG